MRLRTLSGIIFSILFFTNTVSAQININRVSVNIGTIRTLLPDRPYYSSHQSALYTEFQIGGKHLDSHYGWSVYWGFWNDGLKQALPIVDLITYAYRSYTFGFRLTYSPASIIQPWPVEPGFFAGIARHFVSADYVGGYGIDGSEGRDFTLSINTLEIGLNAAIHILGPLFFRGEVQQYIPLGNNEYDRLQQNRRAAKMGLAYHF